ncbi:trypsin-like serine peptidase [Micromonospora sp. LOL_023]|uniref:trypsin-like serine peptidase n=1 Tax=Micromonospora sp. LOL_023 TaxID=3345418 RepID=UPI003A8A5BC4
MKNKARRTLGVLVATAALALAAAATPAAATPTSTVDMVTPVSDTGETINPAVLAERIDETMVQTTRPTVRRGADGTDRAPAVQVEGRTEPGEIGISSIIGTDNRYQATPADWWPASSTVHITRTSGFMWTSASQNGTSTYNRGYSGDKTFGTQWSSSDQIRVTQSTELFYHHDTVGGNSGGPVYTYSVTDCGPCAVAVHAYVLHGSGAPNNNHNSGPRITEPVFNNFIYWRDL